MNSFVYLAQKGFYDDTIFHRIVPHFVIQGGDPLQNGTGGPGYTVTERRPGTPTTRMGTVAMAKTAVEPPGRSGSQFFVVTAADAGLPPNYAILGKVSSGLDVVKRIGKLGDPASGDRARPWPPWSSANHGRRVGAMARIDCGDPAPDFELTGTSGRTYRLAEYLGDWLVLAFYPGDFTPVCTRQFCSYRDAADRLDELDADGLGDLAAVARLARAVPPRSTG